MVKSYYQPATTNIERALVAIWQELLGKENIGVNDNFFELGGHSLLASQLISRCRFFGYRVNLKDIFVHQTISELAAAVPFEPKEKMNVTARPLNFEKKEHIIPLQPEGILPPVFAVHSCWVYVQLALQLGKNQPFFVLEGCRLNNLQEIALFYIDQLKTIQPNGPYYLAGFCGYGVIAIEMARQLVAEGEEVASVLLFESYGSPAVVKRLSSAYMKSSFKKLTLLGSTYAKAKFLKDEIWQTLKAVFVSSLKVLTRKDLIKTFDGKLAFVNTTQAYDLNYNGKVALFRAATPEPWAKNDSTMGWTNYFTGDVQTFTIGGGHTDIFKAPAVYELSKKVKQVLESSKVVVE